MGTKYSHALNMQQESQDEKIWNVGLVLLSLYILLNYIAQEGLLPRSWHSMVLYAFVLWTALGVLVHKRLVIGSYTIWYITLIGYSYLTLLWSKYPADTALYNMFVSLIVTLCFLLTLDNFNKLNRCIWAFILAGDILGIMLLSTGQLEMAAEAERLGESITGNANSFSAMLMVSAIFAAWSAIHTSGKIRLFSWISELFILFLMIMSGGRKTVLAVVICLAYFMLTNNSEKASFSKKFMAVLKTVIVVLSIYFAIMEIPFLYEMIGQRFEGLFSLLSGGESDVSSDALRQKMIENGFQEWKKNPIWGYGLDSFKYYNSYTLGHFYYAHNNLIELMYDLGAIGVCVYYGYIVYLVKRLRQLPQEYKVYRSLGIGLIIGSLVFDIGGVSYYTPLIQIVICLVVCIIQNIPVVMKKEFSVD